MNKSPEKSQASCQICGGKFKSVFSNEHQCKRCFRNVCKQCCTKKKLIFTKTSIKAEQHRCCDLCLPESDSISQYIKQYSLSFNCLSQEGKEWSQLSDIDTSQKQYAKNPSKSFKCSLKMQEIWQQLTPSLREFLGILIAKLSLQQVQETIRNVIDAIGNEQCFHIVIYILCHCDQKNAIKLVQKLCSLSANMSQQRISEYLLILNKQSNQIGGQQLKLVQSFIKNSSKPLYVNFLSDCLWVDVVHNVIIESLLSGSCTNLQLIMSCLLHDSSNVILDQGYDHNKWRNYVWRETNKTGIESSVRKLRKLIVKRDSLNKNKQQNEENKSDTVPMQQQKEGDLSETNKKQSQKLDKQKQEKDKQDRVMAKINEAAQFIRKLESGELNEQDLTPYDLQSMEKYLDMVIHENEKSLAECEEFDGLLNDIQKELYTKK